MPQLLQSSVVCTSNKHFTIVPNVVSETFNDSLLVSFWFFVSDFSSKSNQTICSLHASSSHSFSRLFGSAHKAPLLDHVSLKIDHERNHRITMRINSDINIAIQSEHALSLYCWNHITFVISCNPLTILFKLNDEYFQTKLDQNTTLYDLDLSKYHLTLSSSKQNNTGFNGLFGPLLYTLFNLKNKQQYLQQTDYKQKYLNILIQENVEQNTKFILNINKQYYGSGVHHALSTKQHSLITLNQLLEHQCNDTLNISRTPLLFCKWEDMFVDDAIDSYNNGTLKRLSPPKRNLICVCHDMAGGYHHDGKSFGNHIHNQSHALPFEYVIEYWHLIDIFVYFSHDFITIPPVQWIENAHNHQTLILGTLITEHASGTQLTHDMIDNQSVRQKVVNKLVDIAVQYGFDGWFLNFESHLKDNSLNSVHNLILFVSELSTALHDKMPYGKVLWYDSVSSKTGQVSWQSRLNEINMPFFNACDGLFTDYHWHKQYPVESVQFAATNNRQYAVFTGIDVWGRGTFGGGGYNTGNIVHYLWNEMNANKANTTSIGLFGAAWTFEHEVNVNKALRSSLDDNYCSDYHVQVFRLNEKRLWCGNRYFMYQCNKANEWNANIGDRGWKIEEDNKCWIASFNWCMRQINVNLQQICGNNISVIQNSSYKIMIQQSVIGTGPNYADLYGISIDFKDSTGRSVHKIDEGQMTMNAKWRHLLYEYDVNITDNITNIVITEKAKDVEYWAGHFGTKVKYPVIIILCDQVNNKCVSIVDAINIKNNPSFAGYDTFLYFDAQSTEQTLFWCTSYSVGFGKTYRNPALCDIGVANDNNVIADHCWSDLSLADYHQYTKLNAHDIKKQLRLLDDDEEDEDIELQRAIRMSMIADQQENKEEYKRNSDWNVGSCFDDAFIGGHCIEFQSSNIQNSNSVFVHSLHCIAQNKYIDKTSLLTFCYAVKSSHKDKECEFYLTVDYVDSLNLVHTIKCRDELDKNNILMLCAHLKKKCHNGWIMHIFDYKMKANETETIKFKAIHANILTTHAQKGTQYRVCLGYVSISVQAVKHKKGSKISMDDEKKSEAITIGTVPDINETNGYLDNITKLEWRNCAAYEWCKRMQCAMVNIYLIRIKGEMDDDVNNKWMNAMDLKQYLGDKSIQNIEWLMSTHFQKMQLLISNSLIVTIVEKWKQDNNKAHLSTQMLLFEISDNKYHKDHCSIWCVLKLRNLQ